MNVQNSQVGITNASAMYIWRVKYAKSIMVVAIVVKMEPVVSKLCRLDLSCMARFKRRSVPNR